MAGRSSSRWLVIGVVVIAIVGVCLTFTTARDLMSRIVGSLRMQKPQTVNLNFSNFVDPDANQGLQQMVSQMISDKVVVTVNENDQPAADAAAASQSAGFHVPLISQRKDALMLTVDGKHEFNLAVDRARLQAILTQAGHPDVALPQSIDGAQVSVQIARSVREKYGNCPRPAPQPMLQPSRPYRRNS
jgi:hypothetical protein